jgi:aryl-alcohol dehydrogenase-like predicted oxidoreductase
VEHRVLGKAGLRVPVVGMGTWRTFDVHDARSESNCRSIVDTALSSGANLFDSSPMYGESERVLGAALADRRSDAIVATKIWAPTSSQARAQVVYALESFAGSVDVYQIHNLVSWREHLPLLEDLHSRGVVRAVGATHYRDDEMPELIRVMETGRIHQVQIPYNPLHRAVEAEVLPLARELDLGVIVMQPLGVGKLVGREPPAKSLSPLHELGVHTWAQALLKWILSDPRVHSAIPATTNPVHMRENALAGDPPWLDPGAREYVEWLARGVRD